jgi:hypothetical protein
VEEELLRLLFEVLDNCAANSREYAKAARTGIEAALCTVAVLDTHTHMQD